MHLRSILCALFLATAAVVPTASAQDAPDIFVTPIPNMPFSGVVVVEESKVKRNGSVDNVKSMRDIGRDTHGRIHNEAREFVEATSTNKPRLLRIHLYDPQTRTSTYLNLLRGTYRTVTMNHPPSAFPPDRRYASAPGEAPQNEFADQEDLGTHDIEGEPAHGVRESQHIPAESSGTGKEIVITDEYWYSEDLRINLVVKHSDPRTGTITLTVTQVSRTEPDAGFFEVPLSYRHVRSR
jgi:hypothetical protein